MLSVTGLTYWHLATIRGVALLLSKNFSQSQKI